MDKKNNKEQGNGNGDGERGRISIPRYDYNAPAALLGKSHRGFLVTCSIHREKSATLEAISILSKYLKPQNLVESCDIDADKRNSERDTDTDTDTPVIAKRRKVSDTETEGGAANCDDQHQLHTNTNTPTEIDHA
ncbi:hypothetical protein Tsubulata_032255, partial [Turnera subulata]